MYGATIIVTTKQDFYETIPDITAKMLTKSERSKKGITVAELLIVATIIAVLIAISVPIFLRQLEKSREAVDLANARTSYAELMLEVLDSTTIYTGKGVVQVNGNYRIAVDPIKQRREGWQMKISDVDVGGVPSADWVGKPRKGGSCVIEYNPSKDKVTIYWNKGYSSLTNTEYLIHSDVWYKDSSQRQDDFKKLHKLSNQERLRSDKDVLRLMADYFDGMSVNEANKILGEERFAEALRKDGATLFVYGQDKEGSIIIRDLETSYQPYLAGIGYFSRVCSYPGEVLWNTPDNKYSTNADEGVNCFDHYLLTSNEMLGEKYAHKKLHKIRIKFKTEGDRVYSTEIWVEGKGLEGISSRTY